MDSLRGPESIPDDIQQGWLDFSRKMQAKLSGNHGLALVTVTVAANGCNAVAWMPPKIELIDPVAIGTMIDMSEESWNILFSLMQSKNGR